MRLRRSYKLRICTLVALSTITVCSIISVFAVYSMRNTVIDVFVDRANALLYQAIDTLDNENLERFIENPDENDPWFIEAHQKMIDIKTIGGAAQLYASLHKNGNIFTIVMDGTPTDDPDYSPFGTIEDTTGYELEPLQVMSTGENAISQIAYTEDWGWTQSVYAPLRYKGKTIGIIACDMDATQLRKKIDSISNFIVIVAIVGIIGTILLLIISLTRFFNKLTNITNTVTQMTEGEKDLTSKLLISENNELTDLSKACNKLIENLNELISNAKRIMTNLHENTSDVMEKSLQVADYTNKSVENYKNIAEKTDAQNNLTEQVSSEINVVKKDVGILHNQLTKQNSAVDESSSAIEEISSNILSADNSIQRIASEYTFIVKESKPPVKRVVCT